MCRTIHEVHRISQTSKSPFPTHLIVQSDNTVSQAKKQFAFTLLAYFVAKYHFITANIFFLMVGHTHEDIDQLFGVVLALVLRRVKFETPVEFLELIQRELRARVEAKGEQLVIAEVKVVRDFAQWLAPLGVHLSGAFANRQGIEAPHAFSFKLRRDLCMADVQMCGGQAALHPQAGTDVMCCVKTYMRDAQLQQAPVLVLPSRSLPSLASPEPTKVVPCHELNAKQISHYLELSELCKDELELPRAQVALRQLVYHRETQLPAPGWLGFMGEDKAVVPDVGHPFFPHLPRTSWKLLSSFSSG
jgi:hypothetical protein